VVAIEHTEKHVRCHLPVEASTNHPAQPRVAR
jgi:hypothetical protein